MLCMIPDECKALYINTLNKVQGLEIFGRGEEHIEFVVGVLNDLRDFHYRLNTGEARVVVQWLEVLNTKIDAAVSSYDHLTRADINEFVRCRRDDTECLVLLENVFKRVTVIEHMLTPGKGVDKVGVGSIKNSSLFGVCTNKDLVYKYVCSNGSVKASDIANDTRLTTEQVHSALQRLCKKGEVKTVKRGSNTFYVNKV